MLLARLRRGLSVAGARRSQTVRKRAWWEATSPSADCRAYWSSREGGASLLWRASPSALTSPYGHPAEPSLRSQQSLWVRGSATTAADAASSDSLRDSLQRRENEGGERRENEGGEGKRGKQQQQGQQQQQQQQQQRKKQWQHRGRQHPYRWQDSPPRGGRHRRNTKREWEPPSGPYRYNTNKPPFPPPGEDKFPGMALTFLGTSAGSPSSIANTSSLVLRQGGRSWLFDCGDGTMRQLLSNHLCSTELSHIFITHMHADHVAGLLSVIIDHTSRWESALSQHKDNTRSRSKRDSLAVPVPRRRTGGDDALPGNQRITRAERDARRKEALTGRVLTVVGPPGIHNYIASAIKLTYAACCKMHVIEMHGGPLLGAKPPQDAQTQRFGEFHRSSITLEEMRPGEDGTWDVIKEQGGLNVKACAVRHTVQSFGFVIEESRVPGNIDVERARALGLTPSERFKDLLDGLPLQAKDGTTVYPEQVVIPPPPGRKVAIIGDTSDARGMLPYVRDADVIVHEATGCYDDERVTLQRGHSTAGMAGAFARAAKARWLILNHISNKFQVHHQLQHQVGDPDECPHEARRRRTAPGSNDVSVIFEEAREAFRSEQLVVARDHMDFSIPRWGFGAEGGLGRAERTERWRKERERLEQQEQQEQQGQQEQEAQH